MPAHAMVSNSSDTNNWDLRHVEVECEYNLSSKPVNEMKVFNLIVFITSKN